MNIRSGTRAAVLGVALLAGTLAQAPLQALAQDARPAMTTEELMRVTALDDIFAEFGPTIESSPQEQGVPMSADMSVAWTAAARESFSEDSMHRDLVRALDNKFTPEDYATFATFFRSDFGIRVSEIERAVTTMTADEQLGARDIGIALANAADGTHRNEQVDEMLELVSADIAKAMIRQSVRGMLIGMSVNAQQGDVQVPWDEIDIHLDAIMPGIEADVAVTQRAMMFFAYQDLSDEELDTYLVFLRTEAARKFYALAAYSIGEIIAAHMESFGETLTRKLDRVSV